MNFVRILVLSFSWALVSEAITADSIYSCDKKINSTLLRQVKNEFPGLRLPNLKELDKESIDFHIKNHGDGCYIVTIGDFDGNKKNDFAMLLTSITDHSIHLIVALQINEFWQLYELPAFCDKLKYCYVKTEKPGTYVRDRALDFPPTCKNERSWLQSKNTSIRSGTFESTGIVYVYTNDHWNYVWVSD